MANASHVAAGDGLVPHSSNPNSAQEDVEAAMKAAQEAADKAEEEGAPESEGDADVMDFNAAKEAAKAAAEPDPSQAQASGEDGGPGEPESEEPGDLEPPAHWSADDQDIFRGVDKATQEWLLARDEAVAAQYQTQLDALTPYQQLETQWAPYFQQHNLPAAQTLQTLMQADMTLRTGTPQQKQALLMGIMQDYGIEFGQPQAPALPEDIAGDPVAQAMDSRLNQVMSGLETLRSQMNSQFGQFQQSQAQAQQAALEQFKTAVDADGKPLRPYYGEVEQMMNALAQSAIATGQRPSLEDLYQQACWATPTVRAKMQSAERATGLAQRQKEAAGKQRASKSVSGSPAGSREVRVEANPNESVDETVRKAWAAHGGAT